MNLLIPYQELLEAIVEELEVKSGEKILEAGCGTGNLALKIKEKGAEVVGLDNCKEALEIYSKKDNSVNTILADLSKKLPFSNNFFDKIASNNTLYSFSKEKQKEILMELRRILKPGGKTVIANPKKGWSPLKIYFEGIKKNKEKDGLGQTIIKVLKIIVPTLKILFYNARIKKEAQYCFLTPEEQEEILRGAGFSDVSKAKYVYAEQGIMNSGIKL